MKDCKHLMWDSDGDYCAICVGFGINSHCHVERGNQCGFYEPENKSEEEGDEL